MLAFTLASLALVAMPGPDLALVTRNVVVGGRTAGLLTALGGAAGTTVHGTAAAVGLSALLLSSAAAFTAVKVAGVCYLLWLAAHLLAPRSAGASGDDGGPVPSPQAWGYLAAGLLSNASNPKVALFFVGFLPQFLSADTASPTADALVHSAVFSAVYLAWFGLYVLAADHVGEWLRQPRIQSRIERITGLALLGFAVRVALASR
ncbi:MAG TPA: LysE family translocator [Nocardioides sp.]|nr:LysE family translocator [Nocardioides sp.]